jgi:hypothetical protein
MRSIRLVLAPLAAVALAAGTLFIVTLAPAPAGAATDALQEAITASAAPGHPLGAGAGGVLGGAADRRRGADD